MKYKIDNDLHIHSHLSPCAKGDMTQNKDSVLAYGVKNGLKHICITDHFWDKPIPNDDWAFYRNQDISHIREILPLPQAEGTKFHFGCETDLAKGNVLGITPETIKKMEFIIIPTTHMHFIKSGVPREATAAERARAWLERFHAVLDMDLPFHKIGIAHLACFLMIPGGETDKVFTLISDDELVEVFTKAAQRGVGIELNIFDFEFEKYSEAKKEHILRVFKTAKKCGCKFYLASDAHHPCDSEMAPKIFADIVEYLQLTEDDKFRPFSEW